MNKVEVKSSLDKIQRDISVFIENNKTSFSLLNGNCGIYLLLFLHGKQYNEDISAIQEQFIEELTQSLNTPSDTFSDGITGIGWLLQLLADEKIMDYEDVSEVLEQIDEASYQFALESLKENNHDFLYGAVGELVYLLNRTKHNIDVKRYLTQITDKLIECSKTCKNGVYWNESDFMLEAHQKSEEVINLGISHGQASKIIIFSKLIEQGINVKANVEFLRDVIKFMLNTQYKYSDKTIFPSIIENNKGTKSSFWWSYGDLGIGYAILKSGKLLSNSTYINYGKEILYSLIDKNIDDRSTGINDAGKIIFLSLINIIKQHNLWDGKP